MENELYIESCKRTQKLKTVILKSISNHVKDNPIISMNEVAASLLSVLNDFNDLEIKENLKT